MTQTALRDEPIGQRIDYSRFDLLLAAIPIALLTGLLSSLVFPISQAVGLVIGAATAAVIVAYSMYELVRLDSPGEKHPAEFGDVLGASDRNSASVIDRSV